MNTWPDDDPDGIHDKHLPLIAEIPAAYDRGLTELARGNRQAPLLLSPNAYTWARQCESARDVDPVCRFSGNRRNSRGLSDQVTSDAVKLVDLRVWITAAQNDKKRCARKR